MYKRIILTCLFLLLILAVPVAAKDSVDGYVIPVDVTVNGDFVLCQQKPFLENGTTYIPLRAFCNAVDAVIDWNDTTQTATVTKDEHTFLFCAAWDGSVIDGAAGPKAIEDNHLLFVPVKAICNALGYEVNWDGFYYVVNITAPNVTVPEACKDFSYTLSDLMYLAKITHVECGAEPVTTRIGIANTVVNRVRSPLYPNTIYGAIYDTKHGVQYPPAHTSKMNVTPSASSMVAAKCALNGVELVGDSVAFVNVNYLSQSWAANNMQHYTTLGIVAFYRFP